MHSTTILLATFLAVISSAVAVPVAAPVAGSSGYFPSVTELGWCVIPWNVANCFKAQGHADAAELAAQNMFPANSLHNGKGDAFRHCYWNARMTIELGAGNAKSIADNHENGSDGPAAEKSMDLANNASGRSIGASAGTYAKAKEACRVAAVNGKLVTLK